jgi:GMC oxidoreductase
VQLLGHITGNILKANAPLLPRWLTGLIARNCYGWFLTSEDLPNPESRVMVRDDRIVMHWMRSNMRAHETLIRRTRNVMRKAGFPIVLTRTFGRKTTSHQCGTARLGNDPATSVVSPDCRSHDIANLYITDASVPIPTKPPLCSDMIAPPDSEMISPPGARVLLALIVVISYASGVKLFAASFAAGFRPSDRCDERCERGDPGWRRHKSDFR